MTSVSEIVGNWLGLCRKPPGVRALQAGISTPPESIYEELPGGGSGGSGSVRRGIGAALSGMRILNRNRQLLWFTVLAGLVLIGNIIAQGTLSYITWAMQPYIGEIEWVLLNDIIEFATLFCLVFLLTALVLTVSSKKDGCASFFEGLDGAKKYLKTISVWSFVLALAGMLLFSISFYSPGWFPRTDLFQTIFGILYGPVNVFYEFPFNPALTPTMLFDPYREGGLSLISWIYPSGILQAMTFSVINLILFILTAFVVPITVLEQKTPWMAVKGSFSLLKKNWTDTAACAVFIGVIVSGVFLTYLLVQAASGMMTPDRVVMLRPEDPWMALALVYDSALFCFALLMATVGGIAALDLYTSAKMRQNATESKDPAGSVI